MRRGRVLAGVILVGALVAARDDPLAGRIAGKPVDCIRLPSNVGPDIVDARTILYRESRRRIWRVEPVGACPTLAPRRRLIVIMQGAQLCRNDRFAVLAPNAIIASASCRFGRFVPYDR